MQWEFRQGDCRQLDLPDDSVAMVFCSPPYESLRAYGELEFNLRGKAWVDWAVECYVECLRVCRGLVAWVVEGTVSDYRYSATPFELMLRIRDLGYAIRKPAVYRRQGLPGRGGPDWWRNDWEPIICATKHGKLPWAEPAAIGWVPKTNKARVNTQRSRDGSCKSFVSRPTERVNPGNIIEGKAGYGHNGWQRCHENEAPFPQWLPEAFIRCFCPPGELVLDPFSGSGTTVAAAVKTGRRGLGIDLRPSQVQLGIERLSGVETKQVGGETIRQETLF